MLAVEQPFWLCTSSVPEGVQVYVLVVFDTMDLQH